MNEWWSLFSGVGGFDLALQRSGFHVGLQCESEPWRRRVLASHFPDARLETDVREVRGSPGAAIGLCGGFPCQDLSVAGRRAGLDGARSGLFFEFARIADELDLAARGGWVWLENVPGLLSSNSGRDFGVVLGTLADLGFAVSYRVLDSRFFGVPQRRRRVFIVGHSRADHASAVLFDGESSEGRSPPSGATRPEHVPPSLSGLGSGGPDDNDAQAGRLIVEPHTFDWQAGGGNDKTWNGKSRQWVEDKPGTTRALVKNKVLAVAFVSENQRAEVLETEYARQLTGGGKPGQGYPAVRVGTSVRRLTPTECERLQGFPDGWTAVDGDPTYAQAKNGSWRCKEGTPDSKRYAAMGDAVTVNTVSWIARRIHAVHHQTEEEAA